MRVPFRPRPTRAELAVLPLQEIARDFPETLAHFRSQGVSPAAFGTYTVRELPDGEAMLDRIEALTAWRPETPRA